MNLYITFILAVFVCTAEMETGTMEISTGQMSESGRRNMFINIGGGGDDDCARWDTWTVSGSTSLNHMAEATTASTFGVKVDGTTHGPTTCDMILGVFTAAGSFGCVIEGGAPANTITWCNSYPDTPVYAFNHNVRRWGTFVALDASCTDGLWVNRFYMKNSQIGEKYWTWNSWVGEVTDGERLLSHFFVDSTHDSGYETSQDWAYVPPVYEWYTEPFESCSTNCNYEGGILTRNVVCRATKPKVSNMAPDGNHNFINWDGSRCANLEKPDMYQTCPAGSCMWVDYASNWNCMGSGTTVSNQETIQPNAEACQQSCANYSYAALWTHPNKLKCRCYHVCSSGGSTNGGVYATSVWEQVASGRRKN